MLQRAMQVLTGRLPQRGKRSERAVVPGGEEQGGRVHSRVYVAYSFHAFNQCAGGGLGLSSCRRLTWSFLSFVFGGVAWHGTPPTLTGGGGAAPWPRQALLLTGGSADVGRPLGRGVAPAVIDAADLAAGGVEGAAYHGGGLPHDLQQQQGSRQGGEGGVSARWQHGQSPAGSLLGHRRPQRPTAPSLADMQCSDWQAAGWQAVGPWKRYAGTLHPPYHSPTHPLTHPITHPPGRSAARLR